MSGTEDERAVSILFHLGTSRPKFVVEFFFLREHFTKHSCVFSTRVPVFCFLTFSANDAFSRQQCVSTVTLARRSFAKYGNSKQDRACSGCHLFQFETTMVTRPWPQHMPLSVKTDMNNMMNKLQNGSGQHISTGEQTWNSAAFNVSVGQKNCKINGEEKHDWVQAETRWLTEVSKTARNTVNIGAVEALVPVRGVKKKVWLQKNQNILAWIIFFHGNGGKIGNQPIWKSTLNRIISKNKMVPVTGEPLWNVRYSQCCRAQQQAKTLTFHP